MKHQIRILYLLLLMINNNQVIKNKIKIIINSIHVNKIRIKKLIEIKK